MANAIVLVLLLAEVCVAQTVTWPSTCAGVDCGSSPCTTTNVDGFGVPCGCAGYTTFDVDSSVTEIPKNAFSTCSYLKSVTGMASVTTVGDWAFSESGIESIVWPTGATAIPTGAFYYCAELASITNLDAVTSVGDAAFYMGNPPTSSLGQLYLPPGCVVQGSQFSTAATTSSETGARAARPACPCITRLRSSSLSL